MQRTSEPISRKVQNPELHKIPWTWNPRISTEPIPRQIDDFNRPALQQAPRNVPFELIPTDINDSQPSQSAELNNESAIKAVVAEIEIFEKGEIGDWRRYSTVEVHVREIQSCDLLRLGIAGDANPGAERSVEGPVLGKSIVCVGYLVNES